MDDDVVEALLLPLVADVFGEFVVPLGSGGVGFLGEDAMLAAFFLGRGDRFKFGFNFGFAGGRSRSETENLGLDGRAERKSDQQGEAVGGHGVSAGIMLSGFQETSC